MILLDTEMLTILHGPPSTVRNRMIERLEAAADAGDEVVASIVSFEEQMRGWLSYISRRGTTSPWLRPPPPPPRSVSGISRPRFRRRRRGSVPAASNAPPPSEHDGP